VTATTTCSPATFLGKIPPAPFLDALAAAEIGTGLGLLADPTSPLDRH
jgi:hypothetical protein